MQNSGNEFEYSISPFEIYVGGVMTERKISPIAFTVIPPPAALVYGLQAKFFAPNKNIKEIIYGKIRMESQGFTWQAR